MATPVEEAYENMINTAARATAMSNAYATGAIDPWTGRPTEYNASAIQHAVAAAQLAREDYYNIQAMEAGKVRSSSGSGGSGPLGVSKEHGDNPIPLSANAAPGDIPTRSFTPSGSPSTIGSPAWYENQIAAREAAAAANTISSPVSPSTPGYLEYIASPQTVAEQKIIDKYLMPGTPTGDAFLIANAQAQAIFNLNNAGAGAEISPGVYSTGQISKLGVSQYMDVGNPNVPLNNFGIVGAIPTPSNVPWFFGASMALGAWNIGEGLQNLLSENGETAYGMAAALPGNDFLPLNKVANMAVGATLALGGFVPFLLQTPVNLAAGLSLVATNPVGAAGSAFGVVKEMGEGMWAREQTNPGSIAGTLVGMYAGGKLLELGAGKIADSLPRGFNIERPIGGTPITPTANDVFIQNKLANSPVLRGLYEQFFDVNQFSDINTYTGIRYGETPLITYGRGATLEPVVAFGRTGFIDMVSSVEGGTQTGWAKYAPKPWSPAEAALLPEHISMTAEDPFTNAMGNIERNLVRSEANLAGKYVPEQPMGMGLTVGIDFPTSVKIQTVIGSFGKNVVVGGSMATQTLVGSQHLIDLSGTSGLPPSDIDMLVAAKSMGPLQKGLTVAFSGTDILPARNTLFDLDLDKLTPAGITNGNINMDLFEPFKQPSGLYHIPTGFSSEFVKTSQPLGTETTAALKLLVTKTGAPGMVDLVDIASGLSRESENLPYKQFQPIGTNPHTALSAEAQMDIFKTLSGLGESGKLVGSRPIADILNPKHFRDVSSSDIDLEIAKSKILAASGDFGAAIKLNQPVPRPNLLPSSMNVAPNLLLGMSETGKNIGFGGRPANGIVPLEAPSQKGFHIAEVGDASQTDRILGAQTIEKSIGVRTHIWESVGGPVLGPSLEYNYLSALSRSFGEGKHGQLTGYWEYNPITDTTRLVSTSGKMEKDVISIYATLRGITSTAMESGNIPLASRYNRLSGIMENIAKENNIDITKAFSEDILAGKKIPEVTNDMEQKIIMDRLASLESTNSPSRKIILPEKRGFSFAPKGEEHVLGAHPLEFFPNIKIMPVINVAGGTSYIPTPETQVRWLLSRVVGTGSRSETPAAFIYNPLTGNTVIKTTGSKPIQDLTKLFALTQYIAKTAYQNQFYDLGKDFEFASNAIGQRLKSEYKVNVGDIIPEPDMLKGIPKGPIDISSALGMNMGGLGKAGASAKEAYPTSYPSAEKLVDQKGSYGYPLLFTGTKEPAYPKLVLSEYPELKYPSVIKTSYPSSPSYPSLQNYPSSLNYSSSPNYPTYPGETKYPPKYPIITNYPGGSNNTPQYPISENYYPFVLHVVTPPIIPPLYPIITPIENPDKWWKKHQKRRGFRFVEIFSFDTYKGFEVPFRYGKGGEKAINPPFRFMEIFSFDTKKGTNVPERFGKGGRGGIVANPNNLFLEGPGRPIEKVLPKEDIAGQMKWYKSGPRLLNDTKSPKNIVVPKDKNIHPMHPINMPKNPFMLGKKVSRKIS